MSELVAERPGSLRWLERFEQRHGKRLHHLARQLFGSDADDATQEVYERLAGIDPDTRPISNLDGYLWSAARRDLLDIHRRRRRRPREEQLDPAIAEHTLASFRENPFTQASRGERRARVRQELDALPVIYREVLILRDVEQLSYREIGEVLEVPIGTVKSRVAAATAELARKLQHWRNS
ncbi:MAG: RNA polymerase sigma factor [Planctomycetota bacterium]